MSLGLGLVGLALAGVLAALLVQARREGDRLRARLEASSTELQNLQLAFSRFAPDDVIERIIAGGGADVGEKKDVTVLFADLVGFTALSETVEPPVLVRILNGYFEAMSQVITDHNGYVSTLIGDGILALFGAMAPNPWQANDAAHAALAMRHSLAAYNLELEAQDLPTLRVGIGLHRGSGVAGLVGSRQRKEFTFVGRIVNIAARIQGLTRELGGDILVTGELSRQLDPRFHIEALPDTKVKGVERALEIFRLVGHGEGSGNS